MNTRPFFYKETNGIRISVRPMYLPQESQPLIQRYVFGYFVRIENTTRRTVQLLARRWHIVDSVGEAYDIAGEGVVGEQPVFTPGHVHEYHSFCVLKSAEGSMQGAYQFRNQDDTMFNADIPLFFLRADDSAPPRL